MEVSDTQFQQNMLKSFWDKHIIVSFMVSEKLGFKVNY
jgi:hypothetical protein